MLSKEQQYGLQKFKRGENVMISGPGGSGKSFLIEHMVQHLHATQTIYQVTSTTGCSSILLANNIRMSGKPIVVKTIHSWSGIRLAKGSVDDILTQVFKNPRVVREWKRTRVLIIDEVSMLSKKIFNALEKIARTVRGNSRPFGGIQVVCLGDFYQLPPVGDPYDPDSSAFCFESPAWYKVFPIENHVELVTIFRQKDALYKSILNEVRRGELSESSREALMQRVDKAYDPAEHGGILPMKIFPTKHQVNLVNAYQYKQLEAEERAFKVFIQTRANRYVDTGDPIDPDVLEKCQHMTVQEIEYESQNLVGSVPPDEEIRLKVGTPVMCLVNLDVENGIANGSMGIITDFVGTLENAHDRTPLVRFYNGVEKAIMRYTWQNSEYPTICVSQLPLALSYASSIHKMQGASLDVCEMNLGATVFAEHQIYVALSRVRSLEGVYLKAFHPHRIRVNPKVVQFYQQFRPVLETESGDASVVPEVTYHTAGVQEGTECPICLDDIEYPCTTACAHVFCKDCITRLIHCSMGGEAACPMCRAPVTMNSMRCEKPEGRGYAKKSVFGFSNGRTKSLFVRKTY